MHITIETIDLNDLLTANSSMITFMGEAGQHLHEMSVEAQDGFGFVADLISAHVKSLGSPGSALRVSDLSDNGEHLGETRK